LTAVASFLDARAHGGDWLVRIEDLDVPRSVQGAADAILRCLERHGLHWSGAVTYQIQRHAVYEQALRRLDAMGLTFHCTCSRASLADEPIYPGTCRHRRTAGRTGSAVRIRVPCTRFEFMDRIQGRYGQDLATEVGDFVVRRRDGLIAYQLAVVVDDADQGITHVVRGADLLDNTPRQLFLQSTLGLPQPVYAHVPIVVDRQGVKLSKQTGAVPVDARDPSANLLRVLGLLQQDPPAELERAPAPTIVEWASAHWRLDRVPQASIPGFEDDG